MNIACGELYTFLRESELAQESYIEALTQLRSQPDTPSAHVCTARICRGMGELLEYENPQEALAWLRRGLDVLAGNDRAEEARLLNRTGAVQIAIGAYDSAREALERSLALLPPEPGSLHSVVLMHLGVIHCSQGELERGEEYFLRALPICRQLHDRWAEAVLLQNLGQVKDISGDWPGALAEYRRALDLAEQLGSLVRQVEISLGLGILYTNQGDGEAALASLTHSLDLARRHGLRENLVYIQSSLADLQIRTGAVEAAEHCLHEAEPLALELDVVSQQPEIYRGWALVKLMRGDIQGALADANRAVALAREIADPLAEGISQRVLGRALLAAGRREEALGSFAQSLDLLADDPYEASRTRAEWGGALLGEDPAAGRDFLDQARAGFARLGAKRDLAQVDDCLGQADSSG
jgi:tetratricopeptide (TPR) repeat protein